METELFNPKPQTGTSTYIALGSFAIGTLLLLLRIAAPQEYRLLFIGLWYVLLAIVVNTAILLNLCYLFITKPAEREITAIRILILLANIPIAMLYAFIALS